MHKIVTGRQNQFEHLRQAGGLSGYPSREESVHDLVENSHASTILSYAYGLADRARRRHRSASPHRRGDRRRFDDRRDGVRGAEQHRPLRPARHHRPQRQRPQLRADDLQPHGQPDSARSGDGRPPQPAVADHRSPLAQPHQHPSQPRVREAATQARAVPARAPVRRSAGGEERRCVQGRGARVPAAAVVLRGTRCPLRRSDRRPRHRGARAHVPQRDRAVRRRADPRPRPDPEGPRLPAGRGRRREAPARCARCSIRSSARRPPSRPATRRRSPKAIIKEADADPRVVAITAAMAGPTGLIPFQTPVPRPVLRCRHRRAARRHRRRGHGDGRPATGRRDLQHVLEPGLGPDRLRRRAPPAAGGVLSRPRRHHRRQRAEPSRRLRPGAAGQGARHARAGSVERAGAARDAARRVEVGGRGPGRDPLSQWHRPAGRRARGRRRPARQPASARRRFGVHPGHRQAGHRSPIRPRPRWPRRASTRPCGTCVRVLRWTRR